MIETPKPPRRLFLAGLFAAIAAGGAVTLAGLGALGSPGTEQFQYLRGTSFSAGEEERLRGFLAGAVKDDRIEVRIIGHSGTQGDGDANLALSEDRAEGAADIARALGIEADRISAAGVGGGDPLPRPADTSARAHEAALARVEVILQVRR